MFFKLALSCFPMCPVHLPCRPNGFELSRPACTLACFTRFSYQDPRCRFAYPAGSATANGYAETNAKIAPATVLNTSTRSHQNGCKSPQRSQLLLGGHNSFAREASSHRSLYGLRLTPCWNFHPNLPTGPQILPGFLFSFSCVC